LAETRILSAQGADFAQGSARHRAPSFASRILGADLSLDKAMLQDVLSKKL